MQVITATAHMIKARQTTIDQKRAMAFQSVLIVVTMVLSAIIFPFLTF
jgi:hypothetical protein